MKRYGFWLVLGVLIGLIFIFGVVLARPYVLRGSLIEPPAPAPPIQLTDQNGTVFDLAQTKGKLVLIFFGYTTCPDVCPATLADMKRVQEGIGNQSAQVKMVFITVDPQRDTPARLKEYMAIFSKDFVGLSGTQPELEPVWKAYGVYRAIRPGTTDKDYLVDHTARIYVIDKQNRLRLTYPFGETVDDMLADIRFLLKE
jgi:protein SCO1/2